MAHWLRRLHAGWVSISQSPSEGRVAAAISGDSDALQSLLSECGPAVRARLSIAPRWARSIEPEDVMQVTFTEAFLRIRTLREPTLESFRAWLWRIAENNLFDAIRSLQRDKRPDAAARVTHGPSGESSRTLLALVAGDAPSEGTRLAAADEVEQLRRAVSKLPKTYGAVVQALDLDEEPVSDVAKRMGRTSGAVHMLHARAIDRLRELMIRPSEEDER